MDDMACPKKPVTQRAQMRDVADELHVRAGDLAEECRIIVRVHRESHNGRMPDLGSRRSARPLPEQALGSQSCWLSTEARKGASSGDITVGE